MANDEGRACRTTQSEQGPAKLMPLLKTRTKFLQLFESVGVRVQQVKKCQKFLLMVEQRSRGQ